MDLGLKDVHILVTGRSIHHSCVMLIVYMVDRYYQVLVVE